MITQKNILLNKYPRGFHLITSEITGQLPELPDSGILNLFICHTSAGLTINENADPSVRYDMNTIFDNLVSEENKNFTHIMEGPDDMPAHAKTTITGNSITIPIQNKRLALGTWQGIYLCEFRNFPSTRKIIASIYS